MWDVLKLASVLFLIVFMLRKRIRIGVVMLAGSGVLAVLYLLSPQVMASTAWGTVTNKVTVKLLLALSLIRMLELVLREHDILKVMMEAAKSMLKSRKAIIVSMPLLIGMLPSVGGAYFSAPMVKESSRGLGMSPEEKGFVNYWFRHPWEFVLPLYPGLLLAAAVTGLELRGLILANLPYAAVMAAAGLALSMRQAKSAPRAAKVSGRALLSFLPIGAVLALVIIARVELYISIAFVVAALFVRYRYGAREVVRVLRHGFSVEVLVLILGVMLFKGVMDSSGAVENISSYFTSKGIPLLPMLFLLPFTAGALTGLTIGFVGATFPLIISLPGGTTTAAITFAFASGFLGVLFSPVHVCLVLTREYFDADMSGIYRRMLVPSALVFAAGIAEYLLLSL